MNEVERILHNIHTLAETGHTPVMEDVERLRVIREHPNTHHIGAAFYKGPAAFEFYRQRNSQSQLCNQARHTSLVRTILNN